MYISFLFQLCLGPLCGCLKHLGTPCIDDMVLS